MALRHILWRAACAMFLLASPSVLCQSFQALAQSRTGPQVQESELTHSNSLAPAFSPENSTICKIEFAGLDRITNSALRARMASHEGQPFHSRQLAQDVRSVAALNWFDWVTVEVRSTVSEPDTAQFDECGETGSPGIRLLFVLHERPFLSRVEFHGSRLLSPEQVTSILAERKISLRIAAPANPSEIWRAMRAIEAALADHGHPQARVSVELEDRSPATQAVIFRIADGPAVRAATLSFSGNRAFSEARLRRQMQRVAPHSTLAGLRGKDIYTEERLASDLERVAEFYRNHGYPEARLGEPTVHIVDQNSWRPLPWPHRRHARSFDILASIDEGKRYHLASVQLTSESLRFPQERLEALRSLRDLSLGAPYSEQQLEHAREALARTLYFKSKKPRAPAPDVVLLPRLDSSTSSVQVTFRVRDAQPFTVHRIEFSGQRRFSDRYYRRRIALREGDAFDPAKLDLGLAQLARTGFVRPAKREDIRVHFDENRRSADLWIHFNEIGRQRFSLTGGHGALGSTMGMVYNVFDLLGGEELLTGHIEGGPESLQLLLAVAKEGLLGTRASLGLSLFQNVIRPNLATAAGSLPFFRSRSSGLGLGWSYPLSDSSTLGVNYQWSRSSTRYDLFLPSTGSGLANAQPRTHTSTRSLGLTGTHDTGRENLDASASVSGRWLGSEKNLLHSSLSYSRVLRAADISVGPSAQRKVWAFRASVAGVGSYRDDLPLYERLFSGDDLVRGIRKGELAPFTVVKSEGSNTTPDLRPQSAGAAVVGALNTEYRVRLMRRAEAAAFFDVGSGWLIPGWLGHDRPTVLRGTNGALRSSAGIELRWLAPVIDQTIRVHYAISPWSVARSIVLPDGSLFRLPARRASLGWALGALF